MKKKVTVFLLAILIIVSSAVPVLASIMQHDEKIVISPMFTYIFDTKARLYINSNGEAIVETSLTGNSYVTSTYATIRLQQYKDGKWTTIKTWYESSDSRILKFSSSYSVSSGYDYRVQSIVIAYSGTQAESATVTSSSQRY